MKLSSSIKLKFFTAISLYTFLASSFVYFFLFADILDKPNCYNNLPFSVEILAYSVFVSILFSAFSLLLYSFKNEFIKFALKSFFIAIIWFYNCLLFFNNREACWSTFSNEEIFNYTLNLCCIPIFIMAVILSLVVQIKESQLA